MLFDALNNINFHENVCVMTDECYNIQNNNYFKRNLTKIYLVNNLFVDKETSEIQLKKSLTIR